MGKQTIETRQRRARGHGVRREVVGAALLWFAAKRPHDMTREDHWREWWSGCSSATERSLALAAARYLMHPSEPPAMPTAGEHSTEGGV